MSSHHEHHHGHHGHHGHKNEEVIEVVETPIAVTQTTTTTTQQQSATAATVERRVADAALGEERLHIREKEIIQPVITRDIDKTEIRQVVQPVHEEKVLDTQLREKVLATQNIEKDMSRPVAPIAVPTARSETDKQTQRVEQAPIIEERIHKKIIEDVQPVIYRDVIQNEEVLIKQPIHEHIVEAPVVTTTTATIIEGGTTRTQSSFASQTQNTQIGTGLSQNTGGNTAIEVKRVYQGTDVPNAQLVSENVRTYPTSGTGFANTGTGFANTGSNTGTGLNAGTGSLSERAAEWKAEQDISNLSLNDKKQAK